VSVLLSGFGLGFGVAASFGPINVLCLTTGLQCLGSGLAMQHPRRRASEVQQLEPSSRSCASMQDLTQVFLEIEA
jgi:hypothetical protein